MTHRDLGSITELCDGISRIVVLYENKKIQIDMNKRFFFFKENFLWNLSRDWAHLNITYTPFLLTIIPDFYNIKL